MVVLSAGPATRPIGEFVIDLPRPRDVSEIRLTPRFIELHDRIWHAMKEEVLKGYAQTRKQGDGMRKKLWIWQVVLLVAIFALWHVLDRTRASSRRSSGTTPTAPPSSSASR